MRNLAQTFTITIVLTASLLTMFPDFNCVPCLFGAVFALAVMYVYGDGAIYAFKARRAYVRLRDKNPSWTQDKLNAIFSNVGYQPERWYLGIRSPWEKKDWQT